MVRGKGGRVDALEGPPELFGRLLEQRTRLQHAGLYTPAGPVFPSRRTSTKGRPRKALRGPLSAAQLRAVVAAAGLPSPERWSPHSLRDTFVTLEQDRCAGDLRRLMDRTRHATLASLVRYVRALQRPAAPPALPAA